MLIERSDALVFFGATGDLAYKKIFPALQTMIRRGRLDIPVIGVAKAGWNLEKLKERARDSLEKHGGVQEPVFAKLCDRLKYIDGDYADPGTFKQLRDALGKSAGRSTIWRFRQACSRRLLKAWRIRAVPTMRASSWKNPLGGISPQRRN